MIWSRRRGGLARLTEFLCSKQGELSRAQVITGCSLQQGRSTAYPASVSEVQL